MMESFCDSCELLTSKKELGRRVRGEYLCRKCKKLKREKHREKTINDAGIKDELRELDNKFKREKGYSRKAYAKKVGRSVRKYKDYGNEDAPIPKGSRTLTKKKQTDCHLTFQERQTLFRILIKRGVDGEEAKERIQDLVNSQRELEKKLRKRNTSEEEIKSEQRKLLEELWNK